MPSIRSLAKSYRDGSSSPVETTERYLGEIHRLNPFLDCFITVLRESALAQAEASERMFKEGRDLGPLQGIPVSIKDIIYVQGVRCTAGSKVLSDNIAPYDSPVASRLKAAGAVLVGTNNLHEFASGVTSNNPHYGAVKNPWDPGRIPGGSSGGSAAAVAAGMVPASIGTDTAGSVRIPAALCGVVGLKPTYGRISRVGVVPLCSSFDTVGTLASSAWDTAALLSVLAGREEGDLTTADVDKPDYLSALDAPQEGVRVGIPRDYFPSGVSEGVEQQFAGFTGNLSRLGCSVKEMRLTGSESISDVFYPIRRAEASAFHKRWVETTPGSYGRDVLEKMEAGLKVLATEYINAQNSRPALRQRFLESMSEFDFLVLPTTAVTAPRIGEDRVRLGGREEDIYWLLVGLTVPFSIVGFPAVSLPAGLAGGMPVGVQLVGKPYEEARLLSLASAYEERFGPFPLAPPVALPAD